MAGRPRQPIDLLVMNGKSHLGKDEIEERRAAEVTAPFTKIEPPDCLSKKQKNRFNYIARQLAEIGLSPSPRRAWIEIHRLSRSACHYKVALPTEGVD